MTIDSSKSAPEVAEARLEVYEAANRACARTKRRRRRTEMISVYRGLDVTSERASTITTRFRLLASTREVAISQGTDRAYYPMDFQTFVTHMDVLHPLLTEYEYYRYLAKLFNGI